MASVRIYEAQTSVEVNHLITLLSRHTPHGLALLRRLQAHQSSPAPNPQALVVSTFPPTAATTKEATSPQHPYAIAFFDRSVPDGLPCFLFSSVELPSNSPHETSNDNTTTSPTHSDPTTILATTQLLTLLAHFHTHRPPISNPSLPQYPDAAPPPDDLILIGCSHSATASLLRTHPLVTRASKPLVRDDLVGKGGPYLKLVWRASSPPSSSSPSSNLTFPSASPPTATAATALPAGLSYDVPNEHDYARILATNSLVRSPSQLASQPSAGIRDENTDKLVAWVFAGLDGSVRTLFVEPEWRGRGVGRAVVRALIEGSGAGDEGGKVAGANEDGWWHTDVGEDNEESRGLFERGFGAGVVQRSYWVRVDVGVAEGLVEGWEREEVGGVKHDEREVVKEVGGVKGVVSTARGEEEVEGTAKKEKTWKLGFDLKLG